MLKSDEGKIKSDQIKNHVPLVKKKKKKNASKVYGAKDQ